MLRIFGISGVGVVMTAPALTDAEKTFFSRAAIHMADSGCTIEEAAQRVINDDQRLADVFGLYRPTSEQRDSAKELRAAIASSVYHSLRRESSDAAR